MNKYILDELSARFTLRRKDMGDLARVKKGPMLFDFETYDIDGVGNLFFIDMKGLFGLMKMQTAVITPVHRDLSFCNFDAVHAMGNDTLIFEIYDTCLQPTDLSCFGAIAEKYADLPDAPSSPRWYDEIRLAGIAKKGKKQAAAQEPIMKECLAAYLELLDRAPQCDAEAKTAANRKYAEGLLNNGGPAVDSMKKMIGEERTEKLVREFMYAV